MSRIATSFVLGFHGCEMGIAREIVSGRADLISSDRSYDWLGPGIYFWEADCTRALEWATARYGSDGTPAVIGAVIDLGNCFDLLSRGDQDLLAKAHASLVAVYNAAEKPLPINEPIPRGDDTDRRLRKLDCAVIRHLHDLTSKTSSGLQPAFDTVRGMFTEGDPIYPGSGFHRQSHVQIAVRNHSCIKGVFLPPALKQSIWKHPG